jgi:hypothetical protein
MARLKHVEVELGPDYAGLFWSTPEQLRTAAAYLAAVVRRLEGVGATRIGLRDTIGDAELVDVEQLSDADLTVLQSGEIQNGAVRLDERVTRYRVRTEYAGTGVVYLYVPEERHDALFDALKDELAVFRTRGHELSMPTLLA